MLYAARRIQRTDACLWAMRGSKRRCFGASVPLASPERSLWRRRRRRLWRWRPRRHAQRVAPKRAVLGVCGLLVLSAVAGMGPEVSTWLPFPVNASQQSSEFRVLRTGSGHVGWVNK